MAKVNPYVQDKLASSLGIMPGMDGNAGQPWANIAQNSADIAKGFGDVYIAAYKRQKDSEEKLNDINNTLSAYRQSIAAESEMYGIIDNAKAQYSDNPYQAFEEVRVRGDDLIRQTLDNEENVAVKQKMAGILTNSFRGKLSETHSWAVAQDTANASNKIQGSIDDMCKRVGKSNNLNILQECLNFIGTPEKNNYKVEKHERVSNGFKTPEEVLQEVDEIEASKTQNGNNANFSKYMDYVYGAKSGTEKSKAKQKIAAAYLLGAIDRGDVNRVKSVLASGTLDKYLTAENKHKFMSMADTKIKAQEKQARMDNMYQIFDIKQNAVIQAASGQYSIPQAIVDNQKIVELGGKPTTMLTTAGIKGEKTLSEKEYKARKAKAIDTLNTAFEGVIKNGKVDPEAKLRSILKFQNTLIANRQYLSPSEYKQYNKMADPIIKSIKGMRKNIFGMPQGEISGNDPTHRGYLAIYNFAHRAYAGKENQQNAIKNMLLDFSRYEEAFRNKTGKEPTQAQAANLANRAIQNQRMKSNKYLRNIPKSGITMRDKYGNLVKMYPNGKHEIIKYGR